MTESGEVMSDRDETETTASIPQWVHRLPFLSDFYTPLPALAEPTVEDLDVTFDRLAELIGMTPTPMAVRVQLGEGEHADVRSWVLDAGPSGCRVTSEATRPPDAEAILDAETWRLIASGGMSPLEAFARGRMRVRGSLQTARRLARQLYRRDAAQP
jgi:hypothetical protein